MIKKSKVLAALLLMFFSCKSPEERLKDRMMKSATLYLHNVFEKTELQIRDLKIEKIEPLTPPREIILLSNDIASRTHDLYNKRKGVQKSFNTARASLVLPEEIRPSYNSRSVAESSQKKVDGLYNELLSIDHEISVCKKQLQALQRKSKQWKGNTITGYIVKLDYKIVVNEDSEKLVDDCFLVVDTDFETYDEEAFFSTLEDKYLGDSQ